MWTLYIRLIVHSKKLLPEPTHQVTSFCNKSIWSMFAKFKNPQTRKAHNRCSLFTLGTHFLYTRLNWRSTIIDWNWTKTTSLSSLIKTKSQYSRSLDKKVTFHHFERKKNGKGYYRRTWTQEKRQQWIKAST